MKIYVDPARQDWRQHEDRGYIEYTVSQEDYDALFTERGIICFPIVGKVRVIVEEGICEKLAVWRDRVYATREERVKWVLSLESQTKYNELTTPAYTELLLLRDIFRQNEVLPTGEELFRKFPNAMTYINTLKESGAIEGLPDPVEMQDFYAQYS